MDNQNITLVDAIGLAGALWEVRRSLRKERRGRLLAWCRPRNRKHRRRAA